MRNVEQLREVISKHAGEKQVAGYVCIGYGNPHNSLASKYDIPSRELYGYEHGAHSLSNPQYRGTLSSDLYYVTESFYNTNIKPETIMTKNESYNSLQKAFIKDNNLKVGSKVRIIATAVDNQFGWSNSWEDTMTQAFKSKKTYTITSLNELRPGNGIELDTPDSCAFPFFTLEVVANIEVLRITSDYEAIINGNGDIEVGCQKIPYATLKKLYDKATKLKDS